MSEWNRTGHIHGHDSFSPRRRLEDEAERLGAVETISTARPSRTLADRSIVAGTRKRNGSDAEEGEHGEAGDHSGRDQRAGCDDERRRRRELAASGESE